MAENTARNAAERRNYRRISDAVALHVEIVDQDVANDASIELPELPEHPTHVVSLSPTGLKCYHDQPFSDGEIVRLSVMLFPDKIRFDVEARVVNSGEDRRSGKDDRFFAGMAFSNMTDEVRDVVLEHIDKVARQSFGGSVKLIYKS